MPPIIAITADADPERYFSRRPYADAVAAAGGVPIILPCRAELAGAYLDRVDGLILSGGDDPAMEPFGKATHPKATRMDPERQAFELALLDQLRRRDTPVLGICLGMQLMCLHAGGDIDQHLPESLPTAEQHWGRKEHEVHGQIGRGRVLSHHRQAVINPGKLEIVGTAPDGVIEAVRDGARRFFVGVQWHPERMEDEALGLGMIRALVEAAGG